MGSWTWGTAGHSRGVNVCATSSRRRTPTRARGYHDTRHLTEVLDRLDELAGAGVGLRRGRRCVLAAWFHDAVYDGERDAEERSAQWAEHALARGRPGRRSSPRWPGWSG